MNKPKWNDAPKWAKYLAMDDDDTWWWYEEVPSWDAYGLCDEGAWAVQSGLIDAAIPDRGNLIDASESMEERP